MRCAPTSSASRALLRGAKNRTAARSTTASRIRRSCGVKARSRCWFSASWKETLNYHAFQPIQQFRYTIGKNGRITDIVFVEHANSPIFDEETINTIKNWRWRPMMVSGKPVEVVHEIEVYYQYVVR